MPNVFVLLMFVWTRLFHNTGKLGRLAIDVIKSMRGPAEMLPKQFHLLQRCLRINDQLKRRRLRKACKAQRMLLLHNFVDITEKYTQCNFEEITTVQPSQVPIDPELFPGVTSAGELVVA